MIIGVCYAVLGLGAVVILFSMLRSGHFLRSLLASAVQGIVALLAVNVLGTLTGVTLAVNPCTLSFCGLFGMPGTIGFCLLDTLLR